MKIYCDCGRKISSNGIYQKVRRCGTCQRLEYEKKGWNRK